jgi:GNAT superfamily N-acetyltransferase
MSIDNFTLREIQPFDSNGLTKLITEFEGDLTTRFQVDPYQAIVSGTENRTTGVVVESAGEDDFVGMGTVRFSEVQFNGEILPLAFLDGLKVRKEFRGKGLGYHIASWRIQKAREEYGSQCVIGTGMLHDNQASHAVAKKWCREFAESAIQVFLLPARERKPVPPAGLAFREVEPRQYQQFADQQNKFYSQYNLYPLSSPATIARALGVTVEGKKPYRYFVVSDAKGNLLAGAQTWARGLLKCDTVNHLPAPILVLNKIVHLLPSDLTIRDVAVNGLWYEAGQERAAQYLWEGLRWVCRDQGTTLAAGFDVRDPAAKLVPLKPWYQPRPRITYAIHGPSTLDRDRLLFTSGRV